MAKSYFSDFYGLCVQCIFRFFLQCIQIFLRQIFFIVLLQDTSGVLGSMAKILYPGSRLIVSEHGIYTREREEEVIKASWISRNIQGFMDRPV